MSRFAVNILANLDPAKAVPDAILKFIGQMETGSSLSGSPVGDMFAQWGKRYEVDVRTGFTAASRGDGRWANLKPATIAARRSGKRSKNGKRLTRGQERSELIKKTVRGKLTADQRLATHKRIAELTTMSGVVILKDTGALFNALAIGTPGNLLLRNNNRLVYGFSRSATHSPGMTLGRLAAIHDGGNKNLPARKILTAPKPATLQGMASDAVLAIGRVTKLAGAV